MFETNKTDAAEINLGNINEGVAPDAFNLELRKVMENIADLSTAATATRTISIKVEFKPESDRCKIHTEFSIKSALAPIETNKSQLFMARTEEGAMVALDADPRQMPLWESPKRAQPPVIQFATRGVPLIPWRTFRDASPVESRFLLRMQGVKDAAPRIALFEIDARWKLDTVASIKDYLSAELPAGTIILA